MSEQIFQNDSINNTAQSEAAMQANYKPYLYTAIVAIIAVGGLGYYLMPEKVIYEPGFVLEDNSDEAQENIPNLEKPIIAISGNTLSVMENGQMVQDFSLSTEGQFALHVLPSQPPRAFITDQDLNFDGRNDLGVLTSTGYSGVNYFYDYYIYNPLTNRFDENNVLVGLASIQVNASKKQIVSTYKSGPATITNIYTWNGNAFSQIVNGGSAATNGGYVQNGIFEHQSVVNNWKTYKDASHKFSIQYPSEWTFTPDVFHPDKDFFHIGFGPEESVATKPLVVLRIYAAGHGQLVVRDNLEKIIVDGVEGKIFKSTTQSGKPYVMIGFSKNGYQYELEATGFSEGEKTVNTVLEMISHFKFSESVTPQVTPPVTSTPNLHQNIQIAAPQQIACTEEAMMCPDGSYVGRSGPNCEFVCASVGFTYNQFPAFEVIFPAEYKEIANQVESYSGVDEKVVLYNTGDISVIPRVAEMTIISGDYVVPEGPYSKFHTINANGRVFNVYDTQCRGDIFGCQLTRMTTRLSKHTIIFDVAFHTGEGSPASLADQEAHIARIKINEK